MARILAAAVGLILFIVGALLEDDPSRRIHDTGKVLVEVGFVLFISALGIILGHRWKNRSPP